MAWLCEGVKKQSKRHTRRYEREERRKKKTSRTGLKSILSFTSKICKILSKTFKTVIVAAIIHSSTAPSMSAKLFSSNHASLHPHIRENMLQIFFRKFETKDMKHKDQFLRPLLHINPRASPLSSHSSPPPPFFLQPFSLIIGHTHSSSECPQLDISPQMKTTHHLHSYLRCIKQESTLQKRSGPEILHLAHNDSMKTARVDIFSI